MGWGGGGIIQGLFYNHGPIWGACGGGGRGRRIFLRYDLLVKLKGLSKNVYYGCKKRISSYG